jgi:DNA (cytosine-5)-methyltransferase 1
MEVPSRVEKNKYEINKLFGGRMPASRNRFQKNDELNDFFIFSDTRKGHSTIHSWDLIRTTQREKEICLCILRNRRKKKYGKSDGNPLHYSDLVQLMSNLKAIELEALVKKRILRKTKGGKYEFVNSKNSSGINNIYRVYLPQSDVFSTLTATGTRDYVSLNFLEESEPEEYKQQFIKEVLKKKKIRQITGREAGKLQGFPNTFIIASNEKSSLKQFGNAVSVNVIFHLVNALKGTNIFI